MDLHAPPTASRSGCGPAAEARTLVKSMHHGASLYLDDGPHQQQARNAGIRFHANDYTA